eukprot:scaffold31931_cov112-Isochrysis_galbana.AAC.3
MGGGGMEGSLEMSTTIECIMSTSSPALHRAAPRCVFQCGQGRHSLRVSPVGLPRVPRVAWRRPAAMRARYPVVGGAHSAPPPHTPPHPRPVIAHRLGTSVQRLHR